MAIEAIKYLDEHWDPSMEVSAKERTRLYMVVFGMHLANKTNDIHSVSECYLLKDRLEILEQERDELMKKECSTELMMEVGRKLGAMQEIERIFNIR